MDLFDRFFSRVLFPAMVYIMAIGMLLLIGAAAGLAVLYVGDRAAEDSTLWLAGIPLIVYATTATLAYLSEIVGDMLTFGPGGPPVP